MKVWWLSTTTTKHNPYLEEVLKEDAIDKSMIDDAPDKDSNIIKIRSSAVLKKYRRVLCMLDDVHHKMDDCTHFVQTVQISLKFINLFLYRILMHVHEHTDHPSHDG